MTSLEIWVEGPYTKLSISDYCKLVQMNTNEYCGCYDEIMDISDTALLPSLSPEQLPSHWTEDAELDVLS